MRKIKSMLLTLICAAVILGIGYLGIVESGKEVLRRESIPEQAEYENVGSNIFYGKIEDDIEIFPWNYYVENSNELGTGVPDFLRDLKYVDESKYSVEAKTEEAGLENEQIVYATNWYFGQIIAYETGAQIEEVLNWYENSGKHIYYNMVMEKDTSYGNIYFYQDILNLGGKKYQVRIACGDWSVISFCCAEYNPKNQREQKKWKEGKQELVSALERFEDELADYVTFMTRVEYMPDLSFFVDDVGNCENEYLGGLRLLDYIMKREGDKSALVEEMKALRETWETDKTAIADENGTDYDPHYSYQVVELKDMILLLAQGDVTIGIYYDPMNQRFCGYNYFYEY